MARPRRVHRIVSSDDESQPSHKSDPAVSSSDEEGESNDEETNPLIDIEAVDEDHESTSSPSDEGSDDGSTFHQFSQLPPELRYKIWEFFCPDLVAPARILRLGLELDYDEDTGEATGHFWDGPYLESMTETFRCLSAIHRESRQRALRVAPHEITLGGNCHDAIVRLNGAKDILGLHFIHYSPRIEHSTQWKPAVGGAVQKIAVRKLELEEMNSNDGIKALRSLFPQLHVIYNLTEEIGLNDRWLRWCVTDYAQMYYHERVEDIGPVPEVLPMLLCYPDPAYPDFAKYSLRGLAQNGCEQRLVEEIEDSGLVLRPMVSFPYVTGVERFEELEQSKHVPLPELPPDWPSDAEEEAMAANEDEEDEYESDGINDNEISEADVSSEDELIPRPISPGSDGTSPLSFNATDNEVTAANFSSVEPSDDEREAATAATSKRKRRVVSDSDDDEDEDEDEPRNEPQEPNTTGQRKRRRTVRTLQSDSETETGDVKPAPRTAANDASEGESLESSSSEESDEVPKKPLSLAERLRQGQPSRRQVISNDSDNAENDDDDDDVRSEDEDEDEDPRPRRGGAFFLDEASENDDEDDGEGDESDLD